MSPPSCSSQLRDPSQLCRLTLCTSLRQLSFNYYNLVPACFHSVMSDSLWHHGLQSARLLCPRNSPDKNTGVGSQFFLQGVFPTQGSNPHLLSILHFRWVCHCGDIREANSNPDGGANHSPWAQSGLLPAFAELSVSQEWFLLLKNSFKNQDYFVL